MAETFTLPTGCRGLKMDSDGTRYGANKGGHIEVDNPAHVAEIKTKASMYINKRVVGFLNLPGERCGCGFAPHAFTAVCPRCGTALK